MKKEDFVPSTTPPLLPPARLFSLSLVSASDLTPFENDGLFPSFFSLFSEVCFFGEYSTGIEDEEDVLSVVPSSEEGW